MVRSMFLSAFVSLSQRISSLKYFYMVISRLLDSKVKKIQIATIVLVWLFVFVLYFFDK